MTYGWYSGSIVNLVYSTIIQVLYAWPSLKKKEAADLTEVAMISFGKWEVYQAMAC